MNTLDAVVARCPAKVNLRLRVLGKRPDGYHELETVFQAIGLWDRLEARVGDDLTLECDDPSIPVDDRNLVIRAAAAARAYRGRSEAGASFHLHKTIPAGGGLGGGSSDAAGAIAVVDRLWGLALTAEEQVEIAAGIGADVPFFLIGGRALGTARGDVVAAVENGPQLPVVLGLPPCAIDTETVYSRLPVRLTVPGVDVSVSRLWAPQKPGEFAPEEATNDLETVVFEGWPELREFRNVLLETGARFALLSGSGSTVYGVFEDRHQADETARRLGADFPEWRVVATRTVRTGVRIETKDRDALGA